MFIKETGKMTMEKYPAGFFLSPFVYLLFLIYFKSPKMYVMIGDKNGIKLYKHNAFKSGVWNVVMASTLVATIIFHNLSVIFVLFFRSLTEMESNGTSSRHHFVSAEFSDFDMCLGVPCWFFDYKCGQCTEIWVISIQSPTFRRLLEFKL